MSKFKTINVLDKLFITVCVFLVIYAWINFYLRNLWATFILSLIFSFACVYVLFFFIERNANKKLKSKKTAEEIEKTFLAYRLLSKPKKLNLIKSILELEQPAQISGEVLRFVKNEKRIMLVDKTEIEKFSNNNLINLLSELPEDFNELHILCQNYESGIKNEIFKEKTIKLYEKTEIFNVFFEKNKIFPETAALNLTKQKLKFSEILRLFFQPNKSKGYFFCGLILLFSSIILPYQIYYRIFGTALMLMSVACKIIPKLKFKNFG